MAYVDFLSVIHKEPPSGTTSSGSTTPSCPRPRPPGAGQEMGFRLLGRRPPDQSPYGGYHYDGRWGPKVARAYGRPLRHQGRRPHPRRRLRQGLPALRLHPGGARGRGVRHRRLRLCHRARQGGGPRPPLQVGSAASLPYPDGDFDLVYSINTLHNLHCYDLDPALREMQRVGRRDSTTSRQVLPDRGGEGQPAVLAGHLRGLQHAGGVGVVVQDSTGYTGDHSFIYFE